MRPRHKEVRVRISVKTARATGSDGNRPRASPLVLQPRVREGSQDDVPLPAWQRSAFEVIEAEFVFELMVLLLDRQR